MGEIDFVEAEDILDRLGAAIEGWDKIKRPGEMVTVRADLITMAHREVEKLREALHDLLTRPTDAAARMRARAALAKAEG
jgi:hypothetical protein